jgi:signal transduction histidine kinase/ligand-binding sensor domain-containing protein
MVIGLFLLLAAGPIAASPLSTNTEWIVRPWQSEEGLPDNTVVGIAQGSDGFLWVATQSALARFDGVQFTEFSAATGAGVPTAILSSVFLDRENRLWIAKEKGAVVCVEHGRMTTLTTSNGLPALPIRMMEEDKQGALWLSYLEGGNVTRVLDGHAQNFSSVEGLPGGGTCQLACDSSGQIWFAQGLHVGVFRNGRFVTLREMLGQRIAAARSRGIWIYNFQQLYKYEENGQVLKIGRLPIDRPSVNATVLYEDRSGLLWIGTAESGLFCYDRGHFAPVKTSHYDILSVAEDSEGNIWVGTRGGGLNRIQPRVLDMVDVASGIPAEAVRSVCQDKTEGLWAVTQSGVLVRDEGEGWRNSATNNEVVIQYAQCVASDPRGGIWVGTQYKGLYSCRDGVTENITRTNGLAAQSVKSLLVTPSGDVWIGTESSNTLQRLRSGKLKTFEIPAGHGVVTAMTLDAGSNLWAATSDGLLFLCKESGLEEQKVKTLNPLEPIRGLCATSDGSLWIGYGGRGLGRIKNNEFSLFAVEQGMHDNFISHIIADKAGRLWFAGNRGIFYVKQSDFDSLHQRQTTQLRSVVYGRDAGVPSLRASHGFYPGGVLTTNGKLLIPTMTGLASLRVDNIKQKLTAPPIAITQVIADGRPVATYENGIEGEDGNASGFVELAQRDPRVVLPPNNQRMEVHFTALSFTAPGNVAFRYKLEGLDRDWVEAGLKREVFYTVIPAGDYTFRVETCSEGGTWSSPGAHFLLKISPYYWQTWSFRIVAGSAACGVLAGSVAWLVRRRHRRRIEQLERQQVMERERTRIAQDLHDDLGSGLTEISFGSEFAQDSALSLEETRQYTQEMGVRARELVGALDEIVWALNPKNDTVASLASYFCQHAERFLRPTRLRLRLKVARNLPASPLNAEERHNLFLAFREALHNVVQHSNATDIHMMIEADDGWLKVGLSDNGCGFDPGTANGEAYGLGNMRRRLEGIGGSYELATVVGQGTTVTFKLPLLAVRR